MKVLCHHIYEYKKGLRNLVLHTMCSDDVAEAESRFKRYKIAYCLQRVTAKKVNVFFGKAQCVAIIEKFAHKSLNEFTHEEDFILGIMLGYDRMQQCERYIERTQTCTSNTLQQ